MIHRYNEFRLLTSSDITLNENYISPYEAYKMNDNSKCKDIVIKYSQEAFIKKIPKYMGIGYHTNNLINELSDEYLLSKSEVSRIILTDNCYNIENKNKSFIDIYNTWSNLTISEYEKATHKKPNVFNN